MDPETAFELKPQNSPKLPKKVQDDPKKLKKILQNESYQSIKVNSKRRLRPNPNPKIAETGLKWPKKIKDKKTEKSYKMKVIILYE